jgi:hypothetical protein
MNRISLRTAMLALAGLMGLIAIASPTQAGQGRNNRDEGPRSFGGRGIERQIQVRSARKTPAALTPVEMMAALKLMGKSEPGSLYVNLTPSQPDVASRGALVFVNADLVEGGEGYAGWTFDYHSESQNQTKYLMIWLKSAANRSYLIDCAVSKEFKPISPEARAAFDVVGPDGSTTMFQGVKDVADQHLVFSLNASNAGWYGFQIRSRLLTSPSGSIFYWWFYSCEVKNF